MFQELQLHHDPHTGLYRAELVIHGGQHGPCHAYITDPHVTEALCLLEVEAWQQHTAPELNPDPHGETTMPATLPDVAALRELLEREPHRWCHARGPVVPCQHDFIDDPQPYRDEAGVVFNRSCAICCVQQEAPIGADELPEAAALLRKVRKIMQAGGIDELAPMVDRLHALVTADAWRVPPSAA